MPFHLSAVAKAVTTVLIVGAAPFAHAAFSVYTDESSFRAAIVAPSTDTFDDLTLAVPDSPLARSTGDFGYTVSVEGGFYPDAVGDDAWLTSINVSPIVFSDFTGDVRAIGGYFFATDIDGAPLSSQPLAVTATDADGFIGRTLTSQSPSTFLGFVSDSRLGTLQVAMVDGEGNAWPTINSLTLGQTQALTPVPEPETWALTLAGVGLVAAATARRRRTAA